ncbi:hypothetical protein Q7N01_04965 [Candidatus Liberibacter asiaticus]
MFKTLDFIILGVVLASITITYSIKHETEGKKEKLRILENKITSEQNYIDLLKAQWALLIQPDRIKDLVSLYQKELQLQATYPINLITYDDLARLKKHTLLPENRSNLPKRTVERRQHRKEIVQQQ